MHHSCKHILSQHRPHLVIGVGSCCRVEGSVRPHHGVSVIAGAVCVARVPGRGRDSRAAGRGPRGLRGRAGGGLLLLLLGLRRGVATGGEHGY